MSSSKVFCFYRVKSSGDFQALAAANISINGGSFSTGEAHTVHSQQILHNVAPKAFFC